MSRKKLLAINFGGIGDEILFLPALESIKREHPDWHISLLLEPRSRSVQEVTNLIDDLLVFDIKHRPLFMHDLLDLVGLLRDGGYDIVVSSGSSPMVALLLFASGIKERVGYGSNWLAQLLLTSPVHLNRQQYAAYMYHDLVRGLGITAPAARPQIVVPRDSQSRMSKFLQQAASVGDGHRPATSPTILLHPGTSRLALGKNIIKTWTPENWSWLISKLIHRGLQVVLAGGPDDELIVADILKAMDESTSSKLIQAVGQTRSLADLAALVELSDLLVCVDSAPMHVGVALNKPLVALFGPTNEEKLLPPGKLFRALRKPNSAWPSPAQQGHQWAIPGMGVEIPPDMVLQAVVDQLREASGPGSFLESLH